MYKFGPSSLARRATLHPDLQVLCDAVLKQRDCSVLCGTRPKEEQDKAFNSGASSVQWPNSKHNHTPSLAVDLAPYIPGVDTYSHDQCLHFAGFVMAIAGQLLLDGKITHKIRWGGDWDSDHNVTDNTFNDLVHFELVTVS